MSASPLLPEIPACPASSRLTRRLAAVGILIAAPIAILGFKVWLQPAQAAEIFTDLVPGVGAGGYDVVAYVTENRPVTGLAGITHDWHGATWRFATAENRDRFRTDPERFAPAYGGHCSWAAAQGYKAKGDPLNWRVVNGRLFLNYNSEVQQRWEKDIPGFVRTADSNWRSLRQK